MADIGTTAIGFERGFVEANPLLSNLNLPQIAAIKIGATQIVKFTPDPFCREGLWVLTAGGYSAALWNLGVIAGSGLAAVPFIAALIVWQNDEWYVSSIETCKDPWGIEPPSFLQTFNDAF